MDEVVIEDATVTAGVAPYVDALRRRLRRLPRARRSELLDALAQRLAELAAEPGTDLPAQLGDPEDYVDEFLASRGVEAPPRRSDSMRERAVAAVVDHPGTAAVLDFLPELRPAWWVVRGYVPAAAVMAWSGAIPLPFPDEDGRGLGPRLAGTVLALAAAVVSVMIGRQYSPLPAARARRWMNLAAAAAVVLATHGLNSVATTPPPAAEAAAAAGDVSDLAVELERERAAPQTTGLVYSAEGTQITNFWIYDAAGNLVRGVYVFDQDGRPISTPATNNQRVETRIPVTVDGQPVVNQYPQDEQRVLCGFDQGPIRYAPVEEPSVMIPGRQRPQPGPASPAAPTSPSTTVVRPEAGYGC